VWIVEDIEILNISIKYVFIITFEKSFEKAFAFAGRQVGF